MRNVTRLGLVTGILLLGATAARASDPCIADAKQTYTECKGDCKEAFQVAKDACINKDHDCVEVCRAGRDECREATGIDVALDACRDTLRDAKAACRADPANDPSTEEGAANLDHCIDQAQVVAFVCRKIARKEAKPLLLACRAGFKACVQACPAGAGPVVDPATCRVDAKNAYIQCKADCREALQAQKDLCRNRDHVCVEGCRANRDTCRQPFEDSLDAAIASCNAQRDTDVQNCQNSFPPGPDRDVCIGQAQVAGFQCRDQAREDAKSGFQGCAAAFQTCAEACPPPS